VVSPLRPISDDEQTGSQVTLSRDFTQNPLSRDFEAMFQQLRGPGLLSWSTEGNWNALSLCLSETYFTANGCCGCRSQQGFTAI
jgi:hypothetical protein